MDFRFNEEQEELRAIARSFLAEHGGSEAVRKAMETDLGFDPALWKRIGGELGWTGVHVPDAYGGLGLGPVEGAALLEVMGEALLCSPYLSSVCLATHALLAAGNQTQKQEHLPALAEGCTRGALAYSGESGDHGVDAITATVQRDGSDIVLDGVHAFVLDGHSADWLIAAAREPGSTGRDGIRLAFIPGDSAGLTRTRRPTVDQTRRIARVELRGVRLPGSALLDESPDPAGALEKTLDLAATALAVEQVGGAQRCLDMSVAYALEREQFGRPDRLVPGHQAQVRRHDGGDRVRAVRRLLCGLRGRRGQPRARCERLPRQGVRE